MLSSSIREVAAELARAHDLPPAHLMAVVDVESGGRPFAVVDGETLPVILFEPHIFYRRLSAGERTLALGEGLARERWQPGAYPKTQAAVWAQLRRAMAINEAAALESTSWGVGQVMGYHWQDLGFASVAEFVGLIRSGLAGQIEAMLRYIGANGLTDALRAGQWAGFARGYNGPGYRRNGYDTKLAAAARLYGGLGAVAPADGLLRLGSRGLRVREVQVLLSRAGYAVKPDGDFGPATRNALRGFQGANGLVADGVYGPRTEAALAVYRQSVAEKPGQPGAGEIPETLQGGAVAGGGVLIEQARGAVDQATGHLQQASGLGPVIEVALSALSVLAVGLTLCGLGYIAYGWWKSRQTVEG